jgi:hypothetical protein
LVQAKVVQLPRHKGMTVDAIAVVVLTCRRCHHQRVCQLTPATHQAWMAMNWHQGKKGDNDDAKGAQEVSTVILASRRHCRRRD